MHMPSKIIFLIGYPASGKSTYIEKYYPDFVRISSDKYIEDYAEQNNTSYKEVFSDYIKIATKNMNEDFANAVKNNQDIVIDKMNLSFKSRNQFISQLPDNYEIEYVYMDTDKDILFERNEQRKEIGRNVPEFVYDFKLELPEKYKGVKYERNQNQK